MNPLARSVQARITGTEPRCLETCTPICGEPGRSMIRSTAATPCAQNGQWRRSGGIDGDSTLFETIRWEVCGKVGQTFRLKATVRDANGQEISSNWHVLLLADQEQARHDSQERADRMREIRRQFPTADDYRFFPEFSGHDWAGW